MALAVKISARAAGQIRRASEWWAENRPAVLGAVGQDVGESIALLTEQSGIGSRYEGARAPGVRRLYLGRIRYFLYYRVVDGTLEILALWHSSRESTPRL
jgi:plasmid stabilization system protein ParE